MERKEAIERLKQLRLDYTEFWEEIKNETTEALDMAINSLKTDEAYQLEYENRDAVDVIRCKDCQYFEYDHFENVSGVSLIVAHEMCTKWGNGCKTSENGYCFLAEKKQDKAYADKLAMDFADTPTLDYGG